LIRKLYKRGYRGVKIWQIELDGRRFRITMGLLGGTLKVGSWKICTMKSSKISSHEQQAMLEVIAKIQNKIRGGYVSNESGE